MTRSAAPRNRFWMTVCACVIMLFNVWGVFRSSRSVESALVCMSVYTRRGQKDGPPPPLQLHTKQKGKRQSVVISGSCLKLYVSLSGVHGCKRSSCLPALRKQGRSHVCCKTFGGSQERGVDYDFIAFGRQKGNPFPSIP